MALLNRSKPETAVDPVEVLRTLQRDRREAWALLREQILRDRKAARRAQAREARTGKTITVPASLLAEDLPVEVPASFGVLDGPQDGDAPLERDRNGRPVRQDAEGHYHRVEPEAQALTTTEQTFHYPAGPKTLTVSEGIREGDEVGEQTYRLDPAASFAALHRIPIEEAREHLAAQAEDGE